MLTDFLAHPLTRDLSIDDPRTTDLRRTIIHQKAFLRKIYEEWYTLLAATVPIQAGGVVELGSGAGFLNKFIPDLITTEVFPCKNIKLIADATRLPLGDKSLRAIVMTDVLHHIPDSERFLSEASRCLASGGVLSMIEPWVSPWSKLIYKNLHSEPFVPEAVDWKVPGSGPLSGANGAVPWIIFHRDSRQFDAKFPELQIEEIKLLMPFRYLVSGGISMRNMMPVQLFPFWTALENLVSPWMSRLAMFALIVIRKQ
jgi:SAM-dependent methyltransferase